MTQLCYVINPYEQTVRLGLWTNALVDRCLPGGITVAWQRRNRDVIYVDDEGLLRPATAGFRWKERPDRQPLLGFGLVGGPDSDDGESTLDPRSTIAEIEAQVEWLTREQVIAAIKAMTGVPAVTAGPLDKSQPREVITTYDEFLQYLDPKPKPKPKG